MQVKQNIMPQDISQFTFKLQGVSCSNCTKTIQNALKKMKGIISANASAMTEKLDVEAEVDIDSDDIIDRIEAVGFGAILLQKLISSYYDNEATKIATVNLKIPSLSSFSAEFQSQLKSNLDGIIEVDSFVERATIKFNPNKIIVRRIINFIKNNLKYESVYIDIEPEDDQNAIATMKQKKKKQTESITSLSRLLLAMAIAVPIIIFSMVIPYTDAASFMTTPSIKIASYCELSLYIVIVAVFAGIMQFYFGWQFYRAAYKAIKLKSTSMDVLVVLGTTVAFMYGMLTMLFNNSNEIGIVHQIAHLFQTSSLLIAIILIGKYLEHLAKKKARDGIVTLASVQIKTAILYTPGGKSNTRTSTQQIQNEWDSDTQMVQRDDFQAQNIKNHLLTGQYGKSSQLYQTETQIDISQVAIGDLLKVYVGSTIPVDGVIYKGSGAVNQAMMTGESEPVAKDEGSFVLGGTTLIGGSIIIRAEKTSNNSAIKQIVKLVENAQNNKAPIQTVADNVAKFFVPAIVLLALITWMIWFIFTYETQTGEQWAANEGRSKLTFAIEFGIAVIVISCPCALGLATPAAVMVATFMAAKNGILIKGGNVLQTVKDVDTIVFDKTGTLTDGKPKVVDTLVMQEQQGEEEVFNADVNDYQTNIKSSLLLKILKECEHSSEHPIAKALESYCQNQLAKVKMSADRLQIDQLLNGFIDLKNFKNHDGLGVVAQFDLRNSNRVLSRYIHQHQNERRQINYLKGKILAGNIELFKQFNLDQIYNKFQNQYNIWANDQQMNGRTIVNSALILQDSQGKIHTLISINFALKDQHLAKPQAKTVINFLLNNDYKVWMLTGDNQGSAYAVADDLGLSRDNVMAKAKPQDKKNKIQELQSQGGVVMMIGDGINDSPCLAQADVGAAINSSTDITVDAASIVFMKNRLQDVANTLMLCKVAFKRIKINFIWAFLYNVILIPIAGGILYAPFHLKLSPLFASAAMSLSSVSVICSSLLLRCVRPALKRGAVAHHYPLSK